MKKGNLGKRRCRPIKQASVYHRQAMSLGPRRFDREISQMVPRVATAVAGFQRWTPEALVWHDRRGHVHSNS